MSNFEYALTIHVASRKALDSEWSGIFWNAVYIVPDWIWESFCEFVDKRMSELTGPVTDEDVAKMFNDWTEFGSLDERALLGDHYESHRKAEEGRHWACTIACIMRTCPEDDLKVLAWALEEERKAA